MNQITLQKHLQQEQQLIQQLEWQQEQHLDSAIIFERIKTIIIYKK